MELKIGTQLTLETTYTENAEKFRCKVLEMDDKNIYIDYPVNIATGRTAFLVDGMEFRVTFNTDAKINYAFNTEVLGRVGGNIPMILLSRAKNNEYVKIQRREFVRVETTADVAIEHDNRFYQFVTEDLSAGGIAVFLRGHVSFKEGDIVKLTIVLPFSNGDVRYVHTEALVVRIFERDEIQICSLQYMNTDDVDKQHIVRFCFERQVMKRKKELFQV